MDVSISVVKAPKSFKFTPYPYIIASLIYVERA
jgi:hypothetical protein